VYRRRCQLILAQKDMCEGLLGLFITCTHNASISVHKLALLQTSSSHIMLQRTFPYILGLLNALADLAFVLDVSFGGEGFMEAWTEVVVA